MPLPSGRRATTAEDLAHYPDDGWKRELQAGLLLSEPLPGFRHGRIAAALAERLRAHVRRHGLGIVLGNDTGFVLSRNPDTVRGPDVAFVARERCRGFEDDPGPFPGAPDLAVEVVSPSATEERVHAKVADYLAAGTRLVWVVDPETRTVTAFRDLLSPETLGEDDLLDGAEVLPGFRRSVRELFEI